MKTKIFSLIASFLLLIANNAHSKSNKLQIDPSLTDTGKVTLSLGANMDLSDGITVNTFYGRLSFVCHNILQSEKAWFRKNILSKMGIYGGLYQHKYNSTNETNDKANYYYSYINKDASNHLLIERSYSKLNLKSSFNNYGLILTLPFNLTNHVISAEKIRHNIYFTPFDFEAVMTIKTTDFSFKDIQTDTITSSYIVLDSLHNLYTIENQFVDYYWGFSNLQYLYDGNAYDFFIKATPLGLNWRGGNSRPKLNYSFYFGITENNFGIRIGGEFKGIYGYPKPFFNLFITKTFAFSKFGDLMKP